MTSATSSQGESALFPQNILSIQCKLVSGGARV
jgi:hypothetical protein